MDAFSYLSVLLSIILGLGLTQLLTALGRLIRHRTDVQLDWIPVLWALVLLVIYLQVWWATFGLRAQREWSFGGFLIVFAQFASLYVMAALILPEEMNPPGLALRAYYEKHRGAFFGFFLGTLVISVLKDRFIAGRFPSSLNLTFHGALALACIIGATARARRAQAAVALASALTIAAYITALFGRLR